MGNSTRRAITTGSLPARRIPLPRYLNQEHLLRNNANHENNILSKRQRNKPYSDPTQQFVYGEYADKEVCLKWMKEGKLLQRDTNRI